MSSLATAAVRDAAMHDPRLLVGSGDVVAGQFQLRRLVALAEDRALWCADDLAAKRAAAVWIGSDERPFATLKMQHRSLCLPMASGQLRNGCAWQAQPWIEGHAVSQFAGHAQSPDIVAWVGAQVLDALAALHDGGWSHGRLGGGQVRIEVADGQAQRVVLVGLHDAKASREGPSSPLAALQADLRAAGDMLFLLLSGHLPLAPEEATRIRLPAQTPLTLRRVVYALLEGASPQPALVLSAASAALYRVLASHERQTPLAGLPRRSLRMTHR